ncbi:MAG TPA: hypothetical protein VEE84_07340 [Burkholderiaceae bacterium]|nr:hypothetical protein [Burkholderiaceae bacterium]
MEILYYTLTAVALYLLSDWLLERIENALGRRLQHRSLVFFGIILTLALLVSRLVTGLVDASK